MEYIIMSRNHELLRSKKHIIQASIGVASLDKCCQISSNSLCLPIIRLAIPVAV